MLRDTRELRRGLCWSSSNYLLLEMTKLRFGWAELPRWLAKCFATDSLLELQVHGWPKTVQVDAVWSRRLELRQAGSWLLDTLLVPYPYT